MESVTLKITGRTRKPMITIPMSATVLYLKQHIESDLHVAVDKQILYSGAHQQLMDHNDCTMASYYSNHRGEIMNLMLHVQKPEFKQINITMKSESKEANMEVNEGDSVGDVKAKIEQLWGISAKNINLAYRDRVDTEMVYNELEGKIVQLWGISANDMMLEMADDELNLWEYYIGEGDVIQVTEINTSTGGGDA